MSGNLCIHSATDVLKDYEKSDNDKAHFIQAHLRTYTAALEILRENGLIDELRRRTSAL